MLNFDTPSHPDHETQNTQAVAGLGRSNRRIATFLVIALIFVVFVLALTTTRLVRRLTELESPLVYSSENYLPLRTPICAGDSLEFVVVSTVKDAPSRVGIYYSLWNVNTRRTLRSDAVPSSNVILMRDDIGRVITATVTFSNTAGLEPGAYEFRRLAQALDRAPQVYKVPFEVTTCS
jgi:hypothetical protein